MSGANKTWDQLTEEERIMFQKWVQAQIAKQPDIGAWVLRLITAEQKFSPLIVKAIAAVEKIDEATAQKQFDALIAEEKLLLGVK